MHPEKRHEERELTSSMERALAAAVSTGASAVAAFAHHHKRQVEDSHARAVFSSSVLERTATVEACRNIAESAASARTQARRALGVGQGDCTFWSAASDHAVTERIRRSSGVDPAMVGDRDHDRQWALGADADELVAIYASAVRWSHACLAAEQMAANLLDFFTERGLDVRPDVEPARAEAAASTSPVPR